MNIKIYLILMILTVSCSTKDMNPMVYENEAIAVYKGLFNNLYKFTDAGGKELFFEKIDEDISLNLFDDKNIGVKYIVFWDEEEPENIYRKISEENHLIKTIYGLEKIE